MSHTLHHRLRAMSFADEQPTAAMRTMTVRQSRAKREARLAPAPLGKKKTSRPEAHDRGWPSGEFKSGDGERMRANQDAALNADPDFRQEAADAEKHMQDKLHEKKVQQARAAAMLDDPEDEPDYGNPAPPPVPAEQTEQAQGDPSLGGGASTQSQYGLYKPRADEDSPRPDEQDVARAQLWREKQREVQRNVAFVEQHLEHYKSGQTDWEGFLEMINS